ncbi:MAG: ROK family protein [Candidatus Omnitrophica bacterium]|nr:ROK family protein [Candidatus Omnitrophota bacterium]
MSNQPLYIGIDVGGTKISAGLVNSRGKVLARYKHKSPRSKDPRDLISALSDIIDELLTENSLSARDLKGIGLGVPGLLDKDRQRILASPNMNTAGLDLVPILKKRFKVKVAADNDVNVGVLGECWMGASKGAKDVVGIFPGTGLGGGIVTNGNLYIGAHGSAAEIGHTILDPEGPLCTCGNRGCLEAVASRWAIERDIRAAVKRGRKTLLAKLSKTGFKVIKSGVLAKAIKARDPLTMEIMKRVSINIGHACVSARHFLDPEVIVLGGGIIEACGDFMMPIIRKVFVSDKYFPKKGCRLAISSLGDDAIILGAAALVREADEGRSKYPRIIHARSGSVRIGGRTFSGNVFVRADSKVKKLDQGLSRVINGASHKVDAKALRKICKKKPDILVIGTGRSGCLKLAPSAEVFLKKQKVDYKVLPTPKAVKFYNGTKKRKAILLHLAC